MFRKQQESKMNKEISRRDALKILGGSLTVIITSGCDLSGFQVPAPSPEPTGQPRSTSTSHPTETSFPTPTETPHSTETPSPIPTKTPIQETSPIQETPRGVIPETLSLERANFKIGTVEEATRLQEEALHREYTPSLKIPVPAVIIENGGEITSVWAGLNSYDLAFTILPGREVIFPALVGGKVTRAERIKASMITDYMLNEVTLSFSDRELTFKTPGTSQLLVQEGQDVELGAPLFRVQYNPDDSVQQDFERNENFYLRSGMGGPKGMVILVSFLDNHSSDPTCKFLGELKIDNFMRTENDEFVMIPTDNSNTPR